MRNQGLLQIRRDTAPLLELEGDQKNSTLLEVQSRGVEEEFRVIIMLVMNLIKVFPAWYHPSLTRSVTHAQISQLT